MDKIRVIISGGGTGGHIFPAISIANAIKAQCPDAEFLFVGAKGRMEMQRVPAAGYNIVGLPIRGFERPLWKPANIGVVVDYLRSRWMARKEVKHFKPHVAVGVGGYASSATLQAAAAQGIPCLIQEQNGFAGLANKVLAKKAARICVAYEGMERFFPKDRILLTGNPVRQDLLNPALETAKCRQALGLAPDLPTLLVLGGSLGARTINESLLAGYAQLAAQPLQVLWQTGRYYYEKVAAQLAACGASKHIVATAFVDHMDWAYKAADLVISRAGASSISELCLLGKPSILVPSPNVTEDHQTHNAMALCRRDAALMVRDAEAQEQLVTLTIDTLHNAPLLEKLGANAHGMAFKDAAAVIAREVIQLAETKR